jgi:hypothetical protein
MVACSWLSNTIESSFARHFRGLSLVVDSPVTARCAGMMGLCCKSSVFRFSRRSSV